MRAAGFLHRRDLRPPLTRRSFLPTRYPATYPCSSLGQPIEMKFTDSVCVRVLGRKTRAAISGAAPVRLLSTSSLRCSQDSLRADSSSFSGDLLQGNGSPDLPPQATSQLDPLLFSGELPSPRAIDCSCPSSEHFTRSLLVVIPTPAVDWIIPARWRHRVMFWVWRKAQLKANHEARVMAKISDPRSTFRWVKRGENSTTKP
ncbi:hypothetical protein E3N88_03003 [Mikania micrantha]|uniref:Uncharacterized protein n=1 Tax=Mikania micrantha TaxID=192012 RepID=A0A5N6Q7W9_9ASTR|nr:hypothetical protein E3N88_03003 [Mikania micrantha]